MPRKPQPENDTDTFSGSTFAATAEEDIAEEECRVTHVVVEGQELVSCPTSVFDVEFVVGSA